MRILHVITSLQIGGAEKLMVDMLPILQQQGNIVELAIFDCERTSFYTTLENKGVKIIPLGRPGCSVYNPQLAYKLIKLIRREKYDIVHTHNTACQLFGALAKVLCSAVLCTTEHNTSNRRRGWRWYAPVDRWMYSKYSKIICISSKTEEYLIESTPEVRDKTIIVENGIDIDAYANASSLSFEKNPNNCIISMVAGFRYQKDQDTLIRALSLLPGRFTLWLVGDGERRSELENLITVLNLKDRVRLLGKRSDVASILKSSDIVVMSSHWEGFGLAAVEGMAVGKPVIVSDIPGIREIVEGAGVLFKKGDEHDLADKILTLAENPDFYKETTQKCIMRANDFSIKKMAEGYLKVYKELIHK